MSIDAATWLHSRGLSMSEEATELFEASCNRARAGASASLGKPVEVEIPRALQLASDFLHELSEEFALNVEE